MPALQQSAPYASFCPDDPVGGHDWEPLIALGGWCSCRWCAMSTAPADRGA